MSGRRREECSSKLLKTTLTPCNSAANSLDVCASLDIDNVTIEKDMLTPMKVAEHVSKTMGPGDGEASPVRRMPDSIMIEILAYLSVKDLCRVAGVCRGWNHLVRQKPLWRSVDLSPYMVSLPNLRKLVFAYFSDSLRRLHLRGFLRSVKKTECISDSLLKELGKRCPNMQELCISIADLSKANSTNLPPKLETLKLLTCNYPTCWLVDAFKQAKLDSLKHLDVTDSNGFGARDLEALRPKPLASLQSLNCNGCYRISHRGTGRAGGVGIIAEVFPNLEELNLGKVMLNNEALNKIGSNLTHLKKIKLNVSAEPDSELFDLQHLIPLQELEELDLNNNAPRTSDFPDRYDGNNLVGLVNALPKLKVLIVSSGVVKEDHVKRMKNACAMPVGERDSKLMWRVHFFPQSQLKELAKQQSGRQYMYSKNM